MQGKFSYHGLNNSCGIKTLQHAAVAAILHATVAAILHATVAGVCLYIFAKCIYNVSKVTIVEHILLACAQLVTLNTLCIRQIQANLFTCHLAHIYSFNLHSLHLDKFKK